jgi:ubiquinone/menaquinone biosynthesis C-methylase UbiE
MLPGADVRYGPCAMSSKVTVNWRSDHPWAAVYDFFVEREELSRPVGRILFGTDTRLLYRALEAMGDVPDGGAILDIPCGGGVALRGLAPTREVRYVAADISQAMLDRTAEMARRRGLDGIELRIADVERLPFADGEFDLCLSFAGLHCFPDPARATREIARCLGAGGRFVGSVFLTDGGPRFAPLIALGRAAGLMGPSGGQADLEGWLREAGLVAVQIERSGAIGYFRATRPG